MNEQSINFLFWLFPILLEYQFTENIENITIEINHVQGLNK
jgi:hypothetical protein